MQRYAYRHGSYTLSEWTEINPIIVEDELVLEKDTGLFKIGDGVNRYLDLQYSVLTDNLISQVAIPSTDTIYSTKLIKDLIDTIIKSKENKIETNLNWISIGDSITWYDTNTTALMTRGYQSYVKDVLSFTSHADVLWNGGSWLRFAQEPTLVPAGVADLYTIMLGINDFARNLPVGTVADYEDNTGDDTLYGCIRMYTDYLKTISPNAVIALCTPNYAYGFSGFLPNANTANSNGDTLLDFVNAIKDVCSTYGYGLIDVYENSGFTWDNAKSLCIDTALHPNNIGMAMVADVVSAYIESLLTTQIVDYVNKRVGVGIIPSSKHDIDGGVGNTVNGVNGVVARVGGTDGSRTSLMIHNKTTQAGSPRQSSVEFSSDTVKQSLGTDLYQNNGNTFYLYDRANSRIRLLIDALHNWDVNGELTATKLIMKNGASTNILMADGSVMAADLSTLNTTDKTLIGALNELCSRIEALEPA